MRVAIWVESLMGYGHALRALNLLSALRPAAGCVISGSISGNRLLEGRLGGARLVPLTRLSINDLRRPYPAVGSSGLSLPEALARRLEEAWGALIEFEPTLLLFDHFPFGRFALLPEVVGLIERTRRRFPGCRVVSSVRDIPRGATLPERYSRIFRKTLPRYFDAVAVHGDERLFDITLVYPELRSLRGLAVRYTGYLKSPQDYEWQEGGPCVVDLGGGWESRGLADAVLDWACEYWGGRVVVVAGNLRNDDEAGPAALRRRGVELIVDSEKGDGGIKAGLCIGRSGYNVGVGVLTSRVPAVLVPHAGSLEQQLRAFILSEIGRAASAPEEELAAGTCSLTAKTQEAAALAASWSPRRAEPLLATPESLSRAFA